MHRVIILLAGFAVLLFSKTPAASDDEQAIERFEALIKAEQFTDAISQLESYTAIHVDSWRALYQLGYAYFRSHQIWLSLNMLSKSLAMHSDFAEAHKILAFDLNILGRKDLAVRELEKAIDLAPSSWESRYELGRIYFERGSYLQAVDQFEKVKLAAPEFVKTYHNLGLAYSALDDSAKAAENFEAGLRLNARQKEPSAWPLIDYATYLNLQGDYEKACKLLRAAIQINSSWAQEFEELSKSYRGLGQTGEAINSLKKAVSLNSYKIEDHYVLATLYRQTHQPEEAKRELVKYEQGRQTDGAQQP